MSAMGSIVFCEQRNKLVRMSSTGRLGNGESHKGFS